MPMISEKNFQRKKDLNQLYGLLIIIALVFLPYFMDTFVKAIVFFILFVFCLHFLVFQQILSFFSLRHLLLIQCVVEKIYYLHVTFVNVINGISENLCCLLISTALNVKRYVQLIYFYRCCTDRSVVFVYYLKDRVFTNRIKSFF